MDNYVENYSKKLFPHLYFTKFHFYYYLSCFQGLLVHISNVENFPHFVDNYLKFSTINFIFLYF